MVKWTKVNMDYPWGTVQIPQGWEIAEVEASCYSDDHSAHTHCRPNWKEEVIKRGGIVVSGPIYFPKEGWKAIVAYPSNENDPLEQAIKIARSLPRASIHTIGKIEAIFQEAMDILNHSDSPQQAIEELECLATAELARGEIARTILFKLLSFGSLGAMKELIANIKAIYQSDFDSGLM